VPPTRPERVTLVPVPPEVIVPGKRVSVHVPVAGKLVSTTLPVAKEHVGAVIVPITGGAGIAGCADMLMIADDGDMHRSEFVTE
jgi:hypothetical protein